METPKIPTDWIVEVGLKDFKPCQTYNFNKQTEFPTQIIPIRDLNLPHRNPGIDNFKKDRMIKILTGIKNGSILPPISIHFPPEQEKGEIKDGFHRFYASLQLGFTHIPVEIRPYFSF